MTKALLKPMSKDEKFQFWQGHAEKFRTQSENLETYCAQEGLSIHTFRAWRTQLNKKNRKTNSFAPVVVTPKQTSKREKLGEIFSVQAKKTGLPDPRWVAQFILSLCGGLR